MIGKHLIENVRCQGLSGASRTEKCGLFLRRQGHKVRFSAMRNQEGRAVMRHSLVAALMLEIT